jgi:hypothetical protein
MMKKTLLTVLMLQCLISISQNIKENKFEWQAPGGQYINPSSFFSLHGYVNAVFGSASENWTNGNFNGIGMPGQLLVPNTNHSAFTTDEALWISSELSNKTSLVMELHLVSSPSGNGAAGPGGLTIVMTEANASWDIIDKYLKASFGTFWSPFCKVNTEWLGAQNLFSLIPQASGAYIPHYNEKGIRFSGYHQKSEKTGFNYAFTIGNGFNAFDVSGYNSWDFNENKTINGRVGIFPGAGKNIEVGFSAGKGDVSNGNSDLPISNPTSAKSNFVAVGSDLTISHKRFTYKGYIIYSEKSYHTNNATDVVYGNGIFSEIDYKINLKKSFIESFSPKFRIDYLKTNSNFTAIPSYKFNGYSFGVNFAVNSRFTISLDQNILLENSPIDNNRFIAKVSAEF